jgi:hypothetical protein
MVLFEAEEVPCFEGAPAVPALTLIDKVKRWGKKEGKGLKSDFIIAIMSEIITASLDKCNVM